MTFRRTWPWLLAAILVIAGTGAALWFLPVIRVGPAVVAKTLCSSLFVSHRDQAEVEAEDLAEGPYRKSWLFGRNVNLDAKYVTASLLGFFRQTAIYREGLGCTLLHGRKEEEVRAQIMGAAPMLASNPELLWPEGERVDTSPIDRGVDRARLEEGLEKAFTEPDAKNLRHTRVLVVVHHGRIVAERYAPRFDANTPLTGWSMAKTVTNALIGLRVRDGKISTADQALLPEWRNDRRRQITLSQLLCMTSGLKFNEDYDSRSSDIRRMLFIEDDKSGFAAAKPLQYPPGKTWSYSSGTTNILARILRQSFSSETDYLRFPRERLFGPLGMQSAVFEPDASGIFVGSSYVYASARDWARLGLFYLQDGVWRGKRLLPEGWVADSVEPTCGAPFAQYGWQIWLKVDESPCLGEPPFPEDAYYMQGHDGQVVAIVPSLDLVIVRLGFSPEKGAWDHARDLAPILEAFQSAPEEADFTSCD